MVKLSNGNGRRVLGLYRSGRIMVVGEDVGEGEEEEVVESLTEAGKRQIL